MIMAPVNVKTKSITTVATNFAAVAAAAVDVAASGANRRMHLRRIEPDFVQGGEMVLTVLGRKFARGDTTVHSPFPFSPETGKIDMRVEHREISLQFSSDVIDGNYEMGRLLITAEYGDERP